MRVPSLAWAQDALRGSHNWVADYGAQEEF